MNLRHSIHSLRLPQLSIAACACAAVGSGGMIDGIVKLFDSADSGWRCKG